MRRNGIYSFLYRNGQDGSFCVKIGRSKDIDRRLRQHRQTNPSITVGPTIELPLDRCTVDLEHWIHRMMREWFDSPYKEHYRLPTEDWIEFMEGGFFQEVSESIS